jgi:hypothetical protein
MKINKITIRIVIASLIIFLFITNPSLKDFKEFKGISHSYTNAKRNYNFILFSIYQEADRFGYYLGSDYYIGIADNFLLI